MKRIASREIPTYYELESSLLTSSLLTEKTALIAILSDGTKGNVLDKSRLLCLITISLCQGGNTGGTGGSEYKSIHSNILNSKYIIENAYEDAFITGCLAILQPGGGSGSAGNGGTDSVKVDVSVLEQVSNKLF